MAFRRGTRTIGSCSLSWLAADHAEVADEALRALRGFDLSEGEKQQLTELAAKSAGPRKELVERVLVAQSSQGPAAA